MNIAFIGLGIMGLPMAKHLLEAGHQVVGHNRSRPGVDELVRAGGRAADSIAEATAGADVVVTMLPDSPDVESVYAGSGGIFESVPPGTLLIDSSTIRPDVAIELHRAARDRGFEMIDAPVSGGESGAVAGTLSVMCGSTSEGFERALPVLEAFGSVIVRVGDPGAGQTVKAANQLLVAGTIQLVAEAMVFLDAHGVDVGNAVDVLNGGLAGSAVLTRKAASMLAGEFAPGFRVDLHHKDLGIYRDSAREKQVFSPVGALVTELVGSLRATGGGSLDHGALVAQVDELSGRARWARA